MDEIYVYLVPLPEGIHEMIAPCADGYTVYIDAGLDRDGMRHAYEHALTHVANNDFRKADVQEIEFSAHHGHEI